MLCMWQLVVLVLTWRSAVLALQLGLDDVKAITICPEGVDTCNGRNIPHGTYDEYVSELVFHDESSSVIVKICSTEVWRYKDTFNCECSSQSNFLLNLMLPLSWRKPLIYNVVISWSRNCLQ